MKVDVCLNMAKKSYDDIIGELELLSDPEAISGMAKFGITPG